MTFVIKDLKPKEKMNQKIKLICGKCRTEQDMEVRRYGKKPNEYTLYCSKCEDQISKNVCLQKGTAEVKEK